MKDLKLKFNPNSERTPLANENGKGIFHLCNDAEYIAIYRRIVAAVNACQGIETNMLEVLPMGFKEHAMTMERIAELEECLQETLKALKEASDLSDNEGSDYTEEYREVIEKAESVLIRKGPADTPTAEDVLKAKIQALSQALQTLAFMARTSRGTAGPDVDLIKACENAENVLSMVIKGAAGILTANNTPTPGQRDISQQAIDAFFDSLQPEKKPVDSDPFILIHRGNADASGIQSGCVEISNPVIRSFVHASQFAMRLLSQNPDDAVAQACVTELEKAISNVVIYSTGSMIQRPMFDNPMAGSNDTPPAFMGYPIKQSKIPPGEWRFEGDEHPYNPADLDDF